MSTRPLRPLVICPLFPPLADAESFCSGKFVAACIDAGMQPAVIFCHDVRLPPRYDASACWSPLSQAVFDVPNHKPPLTTRAMLGLRYQTTSWTGWIHAVVEKALALHRTRPFDLVVSRSLPSHAHLAGYWVASALRVPWLANVNDPWDLSPFVPDQAVRADWKQDASLRLWRHRVFRRADILTFPCERLRDYSLSDVPRETGVHVVPHIGAARTSAKEPELFTVVHAGKLGVHEVSGRSARALLEGLARFLASRKDAERRTRLVFVGPEDAETVRHAQGLGLGSTVTWVGSVTYEKSLEYIADAAVCVLVEARFDVGITLPSKLCDYIAARKPILALSPAIGTVGDLAGEPGIFHVTPDDATGVSEMLARLFDAFSRGELGKNAPRDSLARRFEPRTVVEAFVSAVAEAPKRGR